MSFGTFQVPGGFLADLSGGQSQENVIPRIGGKCYGICQFQ